MIANPVRCDDLGQGPPVLLVHGVAFGPAAFRTVAAALVEDHRVLVVHRRGYGRSPAQSPTPTTEEHAEDIRALLDRLGIERVSAIGVSGGATVLTAFALAHPERLQRAVLHEPALGPLAPGVHALITGLAHASGSAASDAAGADIIASTLAGPATWGSLGTVGRHEARLSAEVACAEVPRFAEFAPSPSELRRLREVPEVVASIGARSGPERREAAGLLVRLGGATAARIPESGNLAHLDNPAALAELVRPDRGPARPHAPAKEER